MATANGAQRLQAGATLAIGAVDIVTVTVVVGGAVTSASQSTSIAAGAGQCAVPGLVGRT